MPVLDRSQPFRQPGGGVSEGGGSAGSGQQHRQLMTSMKPNTVPPIVSWYCWVEKACYACNKFQ